MDGAGQVAAAGDRGESFASRLSTFIVGTPVPAPATGSGVKAPQWRHHLCKDALAPTMDVVLILSSAPPSDAPAAPLNPQAAARARMLAMQAARRGLPPPAPAGGHSVLREGQMKASLWRCGDEAQQVWSVDLTMAKIWKAGTKGEVRHEIPGMTWSPDGRRFAVLHRLVLVDAGDEGKAPAQHPRRFITVHRVSDGYREVLYELPPTSLAVQQPTMGGCVWTSSTLKHKAFSAGFPSLPKLTAPVDPALSSTGPAVRLMPHQLAAANARAAANASGLASEQPISDVRGIGPALHALPYIHLEESKDRLVRNTEEGTSTAMYKAARDKAAQRRKCFSDEEDVDVSMLVAWTNDRLDFLLEGSAYLGALELASSPSSAMHGTQPQQILSAALSANLQHLHLIVRKPDELKELKAEEQIVLTQYQLPLQIVTSGSAPIFRKLSPLLGPACVLAKLSADLHALSTQVLAHLHFIRTTYSTMRTHAATWQSHCRTVSEQFYSRPDAPTRAGLERDMMLLLTTGRVTDALDHLLAGNEGLTQGVLDKMKDEMLRAADKLAEDFGKDVSQAAERMLVTYEEVKGCVTWTTRFGALLSDSAAITTEIEANIALLQMALKRGLKAQREAECEGLAWEEFFNWWNVERDRQDRLRCAEGGEAAKPHHDALTVAELIRRGFVSPTLDHALYGVPLPTQPQDFSDRREAAPDTASLAASHSPDSAVELLAATCAKVGSETYHAGPGDLRSRLKRLRGRLNTFAEASTTGGIAEHRCDPPKLFAGSSTHVPPSLQDSPTSASLTTLFETVLKSSSKLFSEALERTMSYSQPMSSSFAGESLFSSSSMGSARDHHSTHASSQASCGALLVREILLEGTAMMGRGAPEFLLVASSRPGGADGSFSELHVTASTISQSSPLTGGPGSSPRTAFISCALGVSSIVLDFDWYGQLLIALVSTESALAIRRQLLVWRPRDVLRELNSAASVRADGSQQVKPIASITLDGPDSRASRLSLNRFKSTAAIFSEPELAATGTAEADQQTQVSYWDLSGIDAEDISM
ncbi:Anaphase-promoting complex subunit 4 long domain [Ceraceosorus bombacis]|uniref:Anaphase-promoting complex subunit 4 n=1 Tax=Ceraceosorus bombacis TaxID=401625 RepID=A0A0P1BJZ7_9BASI|nr:Anaphase-promoting complex subunit 4 long domain [Ceraceosorus bombacis]